MTDFNLWVNSFYENLDPFYLNYFTGSILLAMGLIAAAAVIFSITYSLYMIASAWLRRKLKANKKFMAWLEK